MFYIFISTNEKEKIDSIHYRNFFSLKTFLNDLNQNIEKFLGQKLLKNQIAKESINFMISRDNISDQIKNRIEKYKYKLEELCKIVSHIYEFSDNDEFLKYVISGVISTKSMEDEIEDSSCEDDTSEKVEDDETYMNPIDRLFEALEKKEPTHFAVKQYKKYKLAVGKTAKSILISCGARLAPFDI